MSFTIRKAEEKDVPSIALLEQLCFRTPWPEEFIYEDLVISKNHYLLLEENGEPAGYAGMWIILDEAHLNNICIHPDHRGGGRGKALLTALMQDAVNMGAGSMTLEVRVSNAPAIHLYENTGFISAGIRKKYYQDNNEDACIMWNTDLRKTLSEQ